MEIQEELLKHLDIEYSYRLARRMEQFRSNKELGYRTAGSEAEFRTGELLRAEMESIGLSEVTKDAVTVDGWEFRKAELLVRDGTGEEQRIQLGAYQTTLVTQGREACPLMYLGKGTAKDYEGKDVKGKLVLVDINQRDEWWINYPVYQAHLKGAKALIAVQSGGYGEIDEEALNAQDIAGPEDAPAFSVSRRDAEKLKKLLADREEIDVELDADTRVMRNCTTYNITGRIPGHHADRIVMLSAHYDSYFSGFQDDNTAVSMMLGIARAILKSGWKPENTLLFCAMAAEEWGVADSNFDWSAGAYEEVFTVHPEWAGQVIADLNFELPALAHGTRARIRCCHEYVDFLRDYLTRLPGLTEAYPDETAVTSPIETWSDDFSIAIAGIPSMVNDFTGGSFMETHYHSQFDNDSFYDEAVYRLHHELFLLLIEALDRTAVVPLNFARVMQQARKAAGQTCIGEDIRLSEDLAQFCSLLKQAEERAQQEYQELCADNDCYSRLLLAGDRETAEELYRSLRGRERRLLKQFKQAQTALVRIDWYGNVLYPHEILLHNMKLLEEMTEYLKEKKLSLALERLYELDNNAYAFTFDEEVYRHFTDYVFNQPRERLKWGYGRLMQHEDMYHIVQSLLKKKEENTEDYETEKEYLEEARKNQRTRLLAVIEELSEMVRETFLRQMPEAEKYEK